jgi:hypothetical protein
MELSEDQIKEVLRLSEPLLKYVKDNLCKKQDKVVMTIERQEVIILKNANTDEGQKDVELIIK